jgi:hypothetical protein
MDSVSALWLLAGYITLITGVLVFIIIKLAGHIKEDDQVHKDVVVLQAIIQDMQEKKKNVKR